MKNWVLSTNPTFLCVNVISVNIPCHSKICVRILESRKLKTFVGVFDWLVSYAVCD